MAANDRFFQKHFGKAFLTLQDFEKEFYNELIKFSTSKSGKLPTSTKAKEFASNFIKSNPAAVAQFNPKYLNNLETQSANVLNAYKKYTNSLNKATKTQDNINNLSQQEGNTLEQRIKSAKERMFERRQNDKIDSDLQKPIDIYDRSMAVEAIRAVGNIASSFIPVMSSNNQAQFLNTSSFKGRDAILGAMLEQGVARAEQTKSITSSLLGGVGNIASMLLPGGIGIGAKLIGGAAISSFTGAASGLIGQSLANYDLTKTQGQVLKTREIFASYDLSRMQNRIGGTAGGQSLNSVYNVGGKEVPVSGKIAQGLTDGTISVGDLQYLSGAVNFLEGMNGKQNFNLGSAMQYTKIAQNLGFNENEMSKVSSATMMLSNGSADNLPDTFANLTKYTQEYGKLTVDKLGTLVDLQKAGYTGDVARELMGSTSNSPFGVQANLSYAQQGYTTQMVMPQIFEAMGLNLEKIFNEGFDPETIKKFVNGANTPEEALEVIKASLRGRNVTGLTSGLFKTINTTMTAQQIYDLSLKGQHPTKAGKPVNADGSFNPYLDSPEQSAVAKSIENLMDDMQVTNMTVTNFNLGNVGDADKRNQQHTGRAGNLPGSAPPPQPDHSNNGAKSYSVSYGNPYPPNITQMSRV